MYVELRSHNGGTLVIDCPTLKEISIADYSGDSCFFENKPHLDKAFISGFCNPDDNFVACLSSVINLELVLNFATVCMQCSFFHFHQHDYISYGFSFYLCIVVLFIAVCVV